MSTYHRVRRRRSDPVGVVLAIIPLLAVPVLGFVGWKLLVDRKPEPPKTAAVAAAPKPETKPVEDEPKAEPKPVRDARSLQQSFTDAASPSSAGPSNSSAAVGEIAQRVRETLSLGNKALVIWLLDSSASAELQRKDVAGQLPSFYASLDVAAPAEDAKPEEALLLSVVASFSDSPKIIVAEPTADVAAVETAVREIETSKINREMTFLAVKTVTDKYLDYRLKHNRSVFIVLVTDEVGDDEAQVDAVLRPLAQYRIPVYVIGQVASFARLEGANLGSEGMEQAGGVPNVRQGPDSREVDWIKLDFSMGGADYGMGLDLGVGPYCLTRLAQESGGKFYALPQSGGGMISFNASSGSGGPGGQHSSGSEYWSSHRTTSGVMASSPGVTMTAPGDLKKYLPTYISEQAYQVELAANKAKKALVDAAKLPRAEALGAVATTFPVGENDAQLVRALQDAQKPAARIRPGIDRLYETLRPGESDAAKLTEPRWQAAYYTALGRAMAAKARADGYIEMCGKMTSGGKFQKEGSTTWVIEQTDEPTGVSTVDRLASKAKEYLTKVVNEHPGTPWAMAAQQELQAPMGWKWTER